MPKAPYRTTVSLSEFELRHPDLSDRWQHVGKRFAILDDDGKAYTARREKRGKGEYWYLYAKNAAGRLKNVYVGKDASPDVLLVALEKLRDKLHSA